VDPFAEACDEAAAKQPVAVQPHEPHMDRKVEVIPTRDFVTCTPPMTPDGTIFEVQVVQRDATFGKLVRLEFDAKTPDMCERWVAAIMRCMQEEMRLGLEQFHGCQTSYRTQPSYTPSSFNPSSFSARASFKPRNCKSGLMEWLDWFRFPVRFLLKATIPDVHRPQQRKYWPIAFCMSMFWLAMFAWGVIMICDELHKHFGISTKILGFTIAAIGTSFPNVISCIAVSKQGRTGMAIANALGANIQNVFLALALPWTIQAATSKNQRFCMDDAGLTASVLWMVMTLALMVLIVLLAGCKMPKWSGVVYLAIYAVYLTTQLGGEISRCEFWPFGC